MNEKSSHSVMQWLAFAVLIAVGAWMVLIKEQYVYGFQSIGLALGVAGLGGKLTSQASATATAVETSKIAAAKADVAAEQTIAIRETQAVALETTQSALETAKSIKDDLTIIKASPNDPGIPLGVAPPNPAPRGNFPDGSPRPNP